jgi:ribosomal protein S18 acetylase RimI-like enzyme
MPAARRATAADRDLVAAMTDAAYAEYVAPLGAEPLPMTDDHGARIAAGQCWLVEEDGAPVAVAVLVPEADHLMILSLAVPPASRGRGLGRWMLDLASAQARAAGLPELRLYTNARMERNIRIYAQAGFRELGRRPNPDRPGWVMVDMARPA